MRPARASREEDVTAGKRRSHSLKTEQRIAWLPKSGTPEVQAPTTRWPEDRRQASDQLRSSSHEM
jgi:hypothetical protein